MLPKKVCRWGALNCVRKGHNTAPSFRFCHNTKITVLFEGTQEKNK